MRLVFTKGPAKYDWLDLMRDDGSTAPRIDCPKQGIIPHDMVHYAVESVLDARGFLGGIAEGARPMLQKGGLSEEAVERLVETIQAEAWSGPADTGEMIALYHLTCEARGHAGVPVDAAAIDAIRALVADLDMRWRAVPVGGTLALEFVRRLPSPPSE
jgi:hypothetical protein